MKSVFLAILSFCLILAVPAFAEPWVAIVPSQETGVPEIQVDFDENGVYDPYFIRGVGYSPVPIGRSGYQWGTTNIFNDERILRRDFQLLKDMHANTIRIWKADNTNNGQNEFPNFITARTLGLAEEYGLKVVPGFWIEFNGYWQCGLNGREFVWDGSFFDLANKNIWPHIRTNILARWELFLREFKDHPAILFWVIGNENNYHLGKDAILVERFYSLVNEMAQMAHAIDPNHPVAFVNGDIFVPVDVVDQETGQTVEVNYFPHLMNDIASDVDILGLNVYRGETFGSLFQDIRTMGIDKPVWISEYGIDAWYGDRYDDEGGYEDQQTQAVWAGQLWDEIVEARSLGAVGGTVMSYVDEWWKPYAWLCENAGWRQWWQPYWLLMSGSNCGVFNSTHDLYGYGPTDDNCDGTIDEQNDWFPPTQDHFFNEEWWGLMSARRNLSTGEPDVMTPRYAYTLLQQKFEELVAGNHFPVFDDIEDRAIAVQRPLALELRAQDPDGDNIGISARLANGDPLSGIGAQISDRGNGTAEFSWTPAQGLLGQAVSVVFSATDTHGGMSEMPVIFSVTLVPPNVTSVNPGTAVYGNIVALQGSGFGSYQADAKYNPAADFNHDKVVDSLDLSILSASYGKRLGQTGFNRSADLNFDDKVDTADFFTFADSYARRGKDDFVVLRPGVFARVISWRDNEIRFEVPHGADSGDVIVRTEAGESLPGMTLQLLTQQPAMTIASFSPSAGGPRTIVSLSGEFLLEGGVNFIYQSGYDFDLDGDVDTYDFQSFLTHYNTRQSAGNGYIAKADYDGDADIDVQDFFLFAAGYGSKRGDRYVSFGPLFPRVVSWSATSVVFEIPHDARTAIGVGQAPVTVRSGQKQSNSVNFNLN